MTGLLQLWGHTVHITNDGLAALDQEAGFAPDAVLLDLGLPGLSGLEVARRLRERYVDQPLLLVATTGYGREQDQSRTMKAGFDHHLTKPVDVEALWSLLAAYGARLRQRLDA